MSKREFSIIDKGSAYALPVYEVDDEGLKDTNTLHYIQFVRGSRLANENVVATAGVLHETLLSMMIEDLKYKNGLVPSEETKKAISKLQEGLFWMEERQRERESRNVDGTYQE